MRWIENFSLILRSSISSLREKIGDPGRLIHQLLIDMEEEQERVRESVARAIADEILLKRKIDRAREECEEWMERATVALKRGDEEASRDALEQKLLAHRRAGDLEEEYGKQKEETARLERAVRDLEEKIRQARRKQTLLLARLTRAESTTRINKALERTRDRSAFAQFNRLEQRVERAEALEQAHDRLEGRDPGAEELRRQFDEKEHRENLQKEFEELKRRLQD